MAKVITISKKLAKEGELVLVPRSKYREYLVLEKNNTACKT